MRKLVLALALAAAALAIADYLAWRAERARLTSLAADSGLSDRQPEVAAALSRETVSARAATRLAWGLLALEVDRGWLSELPAGERQKEGRRGLERLRQAHGLAAEILARQPASWQAATVLGASRYLEARRQGRQEQPTAAWREPLLAAMRLAPAYPEPPTLLASAYLNRWSSLTPTERAELPPVLERAFQHPRGLQTLIPPWVRLAPSLGRLLEPIPDQPQAWQELEREFLRLGDLERFGIAHVRWLDSLPADFRRRLPKARRRLGGGRSRSGVAFLAPILAAPPDLSYAGSFAAALAALPDGAASRKTMRGLRQWLSWARDLCTVGRCPFDASTLARLAAACGRADDPAETRRADLPARLSWSKADWLRRPPGYRLPLRTEGATRGLRLELQDPPAAGAAIELRWNGRLLGVQVASLDGSLVWRFPAAPGLHLLEVTRLGGPPVAPGDLVFETTRG